MDDIAYLVRSLAPSHALHGTFTEEPTLVGRCAKCSCGVGLTFTPMAIATLLVLDTPAVPPPTIAPSKKEVSSGT